MGLTVLLAMLATWAAYPNSRLLVHRHRGGAHAHLHLDLANPRAAHGDAEGQALPFASNGEDVEQFTAPGRRATTAAGPAWRIALSDSLGTHAHVIHAAVLEAANAAGWRGLWVGHRNPLPWTAEQAGSEPELAIANPRAPPLLAPAEPI